MQIQYPIIFIPNELTKKPILKFQILIKSRISQTLTQISYQIC